MAAIYADANQARAVYSRLFSDVAKGDPALEGAMVDVDMKTGKANSIERIRIKL